MKLKLTAIHQLPYGATSIGIVPSLHRPDGVPAFGVFSRPGSNGIDVAQALFRCGVLFRRVGDEVERARRKIHQTTFPATPQEVVDTIGDNVEAQPVSASSPPLPNRNSPEPTQECSTTITKLFKGNEEKGREGWKEKLHKILPGVEIVAAGNPYNIKGPNGQMLQVNTTYCFKLPDGSIMSDEFHSLKLFEWKGKDFTAWSLVGTLGAASSFYMVREENGRLTVRAAKAKFHAMEYRKDLKRLVCRMEACMYIVDHVNGRLAHEKGYHSIFLRNNEFWGRLGAYEEKITFISPSAAIASPADDDSQ